MRAFSPSRPSAHARAPAQRRRRVRRTRGGGLAVQLSWRASGDGCRRRRHPPPSLRSCAFPCSPSAVITGAIPMWAATNLDRCWLSFDGCRPSSAAFGHTLADLSLSLSNIHPTLVFAEVGPSWAGCKDTGGASMPRYRLVDGMWAAPSRNDDRKWSDYCNGAGCAVCNGSRSTAWGCTLVTCATRSHSPLTPHAHSPLSRWGDSTPCQGTHCGDPGTIHHPQTPMPHYSLTRAPRCIRIHRHFDIRAPTEELECWSEEERLRCPRHSGVEVNPSTAHSEHGLSTPPR